MLSGDSSLHGQRNGNNNNGNDVVDDDNDIDDIHEEDDDFTEARQHAERSIFLGFVEGYFLMDRGEQTSLPFFCISPG